MHANADMHQRVWSRIDHANSFVIVIFLAASLVLSSRASGIGVTPFLVEVTRDLQRTHKYFREPNKLDCSPSTFLEYLTLWGFTWLASAKRTSYEPRLPLQLGPVPTNFGFRALPELFPPRWWVCGGPMIYFDRSSFFLTYLSKRSNLQRIFLMELWITI